MFSLVIPVYNEEEVVEETIRTMHQTLGELPHPFEIIAVDDGSSDGTAAILEKIDLHDFRVIRHKKNRGNGATIRTGVRAAKYDYLGLIDADGTYPMQDYPKLIKLLIDDENDMVVGARTKKGVQIPWNRKHAKMIIGMFANILVGQKIPDINSGMRLFTRELFQKFEHLYPDGFSMHMTITLGALTNNYTVHFEPIDYFKRVGSSTMSSGLNGIKNFVSFFGLISRIILYFRPLKFFAWPSMVLMGIGGGYIIYTLYTDVNVSDAGLLTFVTGLQVGIFGLLADMIARHRQAK